MKNTKLNIKPIKIWKTTCSNILFWVQQLYKKFRPEKVKMINKVLREKFHCVVCQSNKSRFLKQKIN